MKSSLFDKINKIGKLTKRWDEEIQINKIRDKKGDIPTDSDESQRIIRTQFRNLHSTKLEKNPKEMDEFLDIHSLPKLNQDKINNLRRSTSHSEKEIVIKNFLTKECPAPNRFITEFQEAFKEVNHLLLKLFPIIDTGGSFSNYFYEATITMMPKLHKDPSKKKITNQYLL